MTANDLRPVAVRLLGRTLRVEPGTPVVGLLEKRTDDHGNPFLGAVVNNRLVSVEAPLWSDAEVELVTVNDPRGASIYRRCATYLLFAAFQETYPSLRLSIGQSMGNGYHFAVEDDDGPASVDLETLKAAMSRLVDAETPFVRRVIGVEEAVREFEQRGLDDKARLLRVWPDSRVPVVFLADFVDIRQGPVATSAAAIDDFDLLPREPGFVLHFSDDRSPVWSQHYWRPSAKLFDTYQETREWNRILGVQTVGDLNELCLNGGVKDVIRVTEGFHEKKVARIADQIAARRPGARLILIAGPSSSGKTTFSKRLGIQLRVNGIRPVTLSLDNYYVNRTQTPTHDDGTYNFEALEAIDLPLFNAHLSRLLNGDVVHIPRFDFQRGVRVAEDKWAPVRLHADEVLVIEGIHGLNDQLTQSVPVENKFRIFVSALTQLVIDRSNRVATSDSRLIRRIVRDRRYRGYSAADTIRNWPSVRRGELENIFPCQDHCDVMFNSALLYEPSVLKVLAERYLLEVPRDHPSSLVAHGLRKFLQHFVPIYPDDVPPTSILREFIGRSAFDY